MKEPPRRYRRPIHRPGVPYTAHAEAIAIWERNERWCAAYERDQMTTDKNVQDAENAERELAAACDSMHRWLTEARRRAGRMPDVAQARELLQAIVTKCEYLADAPPYDARAEWRQRLATRSRGEIRGASGHCTMVLTGWDVHELYTLLVPPGVALPEGCCAGCVQVPWCETCRPFYESGVRDDSAIAPVKPK